MSPNADTRPARPQPETVSVAEAGPLLFRLFEIPQPERLIVLLKTYKVYETEIDRYNHASTGRFTADSPHLLPPTIEDAPQAITITLIHHNYAIGNVDHDLLFAKKDGLIKPSWYQKRNGLVQPQPLLGWNQVRRLLKHQPDDFGATIEAWEQPNPYSDHYELQARLSLRKISLADFLTQVKD